MKKKSFGIIGNPITHSLSPILHNYWFKKYNIEANYFSMQTKEDDLERVVEKIRQNLDKNQDKHIIANVIRDYCKNLIKSLSQ